MLFQYTNRYFNSLPSRSLEIPFPKPHGLGSPLATTTLAAFACYKPFAARRRFAKMAARLQRYIRRCTFRFFARHLQRMYLSMTRFPA